MNEQDSPTVDCMAIDVANSKEETAAQIINVFWGQKR